MVTQWYPAGEVGGSYAGLGHPRWLHICTHVPWGMAGSLSNMVPQGAQTSTTAADCPKRQAEAAWPLGFFFFFLSFFFLF